MLRDLKNQLLVTGMAAVVMLLLDIWAVLRGHTYIAVAVPILTSVYIVFLNIWFTRSVSEPIETLTQQTKRIADGSYGVKIERLSDDEIGRLTDEINDMSEKV